MYFSLPLQLDKKDNSMKIKAIILDFDGTLADTQTLITNTMLEVINRLGLEQRSREQCSRMIGLPLKQTFTDLIPMTDEMGDRCVEAYNQVFHENNVPGAVPLFPHVLETVRELHRLGYVLTIASSRSRHSLMDFVETFGLEEIITHVVSANDVTHAKPHPEAVNQTLEHLGIQPGEALVVGDTVYDIEMGQNAGIHTCGVTYGNGTRRQLEEIHTEFIIDDFSQLLQVVKTLEA